MSKSGDIRAFQITLGIAHQFRERDDRYVEGHQWPCLEREGRFVTFVPFEKCWEKSILDSRVGEGSSEASQFNTRLGARTCLHVGNVAIILRWECGVKHWGLRSGQKSRVFGDYEYVVGWRSRLLAPFSFLSWRVHFFSKEST